MANKLISPQTDATSFSGTDTMEYEEPERNWRPIYLAILIYTALMIAALALFSRAI